ncbi:putative binding protein [Spirochaetia bacterium]|nr:putative binding protein [Spirochaetia bacterium]
MKKSVALKIMFGLLLVPAAVFGGGQKDAPKEAEQAAAVELYMYCGAGIRAPAEIIIKNFEAQTGNTVVVEYAGMGQLLTRYKNTDSGDVFLSGSEDFIRQLKAIDKVAAESPLVYHTAVMVIRKEKAANITSFADLAKSNLKIGMGDPKAIALGVSGETMLDNSGFGPALREKVTVRATTIAQLTTYLTNGDIDAAVIGRDAAARDKENLVLLPTPEGVPQEIIVIASLKTSKAPAAANQLVEYFAKPESIQIFEEQGFIPVKK